MTEITFFFLKIDFIENSIKIEIFTKKSKTRVVYKGKDLSSFCILDFFFSFPPLLYVTSQ